MNSLLRLLSAVALRFHPPDVRRRFGAEMLRGLADDVGRRDTRRGAMRAAASGLLDIAGTGLRERWSDSRAHPSPPQRATLMDHMRMDFRFAIRSLLRRPGFTAIAVVTLALGVGSTTAIFSVVNAVLLRSLPYANADRIVRMWQTDRLDPGDPSDGSTSPFTFAEIRRQATRFERMAMYTGSQVTLTGLGEPEVISAGRASPDFFEVFGASPVLGRGFTEEEDLPTGPLAVVLSYGFWRERLGGRTDVLGTTIEINGRAYPVVGVAPQSFDYPNAARFWIPVRNDGANCGHGCVYVNAVGLLRPDATLAQAGAELQAISDRLSAEFPVSLLNKTTAVASLHETMVGDVRPALLLLLGAVVMVLLIACANVANLLIARGAARADEMAVRVALGAGRRRVLAQLMTESVVLALAGGMLGVAFAVAGVTLLTSAAPAGIPRIAEVRVDGVALLFATGLALLTTLLFGLAPAARLARTSVADTLRQDATRTVGSRRGIGRSALLAAEVGLSLVLLVGAGLLLRTSASLQRIDPGFDVDLTRFSVSLPASRYPDPAAALRFMDEFESRLEAIGPGVEVTRSYGAPLDRNSIWTSFDRTDQPPAAPGEGRSAGMRIVGTDFFETMGIPVVSGRAFAPMDVQGAPAVVIVNRRLAEQYFGDTNPIGRQITLGVSLGLPETEARTIVGVVEPVRWESLASDPFPELFVPYAQTAPGFATYLIRSPAGRAVLNDARGILRGMDALLPMRGAGTMQDLLDVHTATARFYVALLGLFAVLAIVLAAVGLYGVVSFLVAQRRREIGVRMALGAGRSRVVRLVVRQGLVPAAIGTLAGLLVALAGGRLISSLLFGVQPTDPLTLAGTTTLLLAIVLAACLVPAARAVRIPPASALRAER